ncbi:MAG: carbamoyltransferase HypF [Lachnospiraceae bacterium]|nr:carbamoyltransferase HypF [Lachnospiraceae bacterium]
MIAHRLIRIYGIVQGVGFRPFVKREADSRGILGFVKNKGSMVEIMASGPEDRVRECYNALLSSPPERAVIIRSEISEYGGGESTGPAKGEESGEDIAEESAAGIKGFEIRKSEHVSGEKYMSPDIGICEECAKDLFDLGNRRYLHPFINCTQCGPRFTILRSFPYDRERSSMGAFPLCPECGREYEDPDSRMFDLQSVCCNDCGPEFYVPGKDLKGLSAISEVRRVIAEGGIAAVKGIGGFHLCCSAYDDNAVRLLRQRKMRPAKPFAVMMKDMDTVKRECETALFQENALKAYQRPIVLLRKRDVPGISPAVAPDNPKLGVMLPYAPLHLLLFSLDDGRDLPDTLVMTSGNVSGAPICINDEEALEELSPFSDIILSNNREILTRADDSVMDFFEGKPCILRRSRGYAPLPLMMPIKDTGIRRTVLALGGDLKNCFCISEGNKLYPSAYVGDMGDIRSGTVLKKGVERMEELLELKPEIIISDMHPGYASVRIAEETAAELKIPHIKVQHHYAHILSCMAENGFSGPVIGAAFDGTGYGGDGSIWGSEIMRADLSGYERLSHIRPFMQVGGDSGAKEGWKSAVSMLRLSFPGEIRETAERLMLCTGEEASLVSRMAETGVNSLLSSSAGRLFDAVSAVLGFCRESSFEGEAAMLLQFGAERYEESSLTGKGTILPLGLIQEAERLCLENGQSLLMTDILFNMVVEAALRGEDTKMLAFFFHYALSLLTVSDIRKACKESGIRTAALSGGCFQNTLFLRLVKEGLVKEGISVLTHSLIPSNDGGISAGQCLYGMNLS